MRSLVVPSNMELFLSAQPRAHRKRSLQHPWLTCEASATNSRYISEIARNKCPASRLLAWASTQRGPPTSRASPQQARLTKTGSLIPHPGEPVFLHPLDAPSVPLSQRSMATPSRERHRL